MTLQPSGSLSFSQIAAEFGGSIPHSISEYYKSGANVPAQVLRAADATNLSGSVSDVRGGSYTTAPVINSGGVFYKHVRWADNGGTGTGDVTFQLNKTATYSWHFSYYIQNATQTANHKLYVNNSLIVDQDLTAGNSSSSASGTFSANAYDTIRITCSWPSAGWASSSVRIGGSTTNNDQVYQAVNPNIPTSGSLRVGNFYSGTNN